MDQYSITITNKRIYDFYKKNPSLNFEQMSLLCVDLFENVLQDATNNMNNTISYQILSECKELNNQVLAIQNTITKMNSDLIVRSIDLKKDYIEEVKSIINTNTNDKIKLLIENLNNQLLDKTKIVLYDLQNTSNNSIEKMNSGIMDKTIIALNEYNNASINRISSLVEQNTSILVEKTKNIINEIIPETNSKQEILANRIHENINMFYSTLNEDTKQIINNNLVLDKHIEAVLDKYNSNESTSKEIIEKLNAFANKNKDEQISTFIQNFDNKFNVLLQNIQNPILSVINSSEERLNHRFNALHENNIKQQTTQNKVLNELEEFLNKYRNSSFKGQMTENHLMSVLTKMFPVAEIIDTSKMPSSCDFCLKREHKDPIYIENKDYTCNVEPKEVKKFIYDCELRNAHGIFLSQHTGISSKNNYQIDIHKGNVLVYVHTCDYSSSKIQIAVDIIDTLSHKIKELNITENMRDDYSFSKEIIEEINEEYSKLISHKETIINMVKDFQKHLIIKLEEIRLPKLENILPFKTGSTKLQKCDICNVFTSDTVKSLSAHKRWCKPGGTAIPKITVTTTHN